MSDRKKLTFWGKFKKLFKRKQKTPGRRSEDRDSFMQRKDDENATMMPSFEMRELSPSPRPRRPTSVKIPESYDTSATRIEKIIKARCASKSPEKLVLSGRLDEIVPLDTDSEESKKSEILSPPTSKTENKQECPGKFVTPADIDEWAEKEAKAKKGLENSTETEIAGITSEKPSYPVPMSLRWDRSDTHFKNLLAHPGKILDNRPPKPLAHKNFLTIKENQGELAFASESGKNNSSSSDEALKTEELTPDAEKSGAVVMNQEERVEELKNLESLVAAQESAAAAAVNLNEEVSGAPKTIAPASQQQDAYMVIGDIHATMDGTPCHSKIFSIVREGSEDPH